jgi:hypothetical protein
MNIISRIKNKIVIEVFYRFNYLHNFFGDIIIGRTACLGQEIYRLKYLKKQQPLLVNFQKVRADFLMNEMKRSTFKHANLIKKYLKREDIFKLIREQEYLSVIKKYKKIEYFLMDSFADLTDHKFTHRRDGWSFCCHFSDLTHSQEFIENFTYEGLLPTPEIKNHIKSFLEFMQENYPKTKIVYIHFPTSLDERLIYRDRGLNILNDLLLLEEDYINFKNIYIEEKFVEKNKDDNFPYHYSEETNKKILEKWGELEGL